jgi:hypothetical protein
VRRIVKYKVLPDILAMGPILVALGSFAGIILPARAQLEGVEKEVNNNTCAAIARNH